MNVNEVKYTPAPWEAQPDGSGHVIVSNEQHAPIAIAEVYGTDIDDDIGNATANARLIAAAPDLLAACQAFVALFCNSDMLPEDECHELYGQISAAITKATYSR